MLARSASAVSGIAVALTAALLMKQSGPPN